MNYYLRHHAVLLTLFVVLAIGGSYLDSVFRQTHTRDLQHRTEQQLTIIAAKLQGIITNNLSLISGLASYISIHPEIKQDEFTRYVQGVFRQEGLLVNMAAAPDMVIRMIYPLEANQAAIGLNYGKNTDQRDAAYRVKSTKKMVIAGPVSLVQGGTAFIGRKGVVDERGEFWGLVSSPIDAAALYQQAGLTGEQLSIRVSIRGADGLGPAGAIFFGEEPLFDDNRSVKIIIGVGDGSWQLAAEPIEGWDTVLPGLWFFRGSILIGLLLLLALIFYRQRQVSSELHHQRILHEQASYDQLTGLPNRFLFENRLEQAIARSDREQTPLAILFVDLDNFKSVNDNLGHDAGDTLLQDVGLRVKKNLRRYDTVARYSGDEFIVIVSDLNDFHSPTKVAENILKVLSEPYYIKENEIFCTASIGIALYPDDGRNIEGLVSKADQAMYEAKKSGRNTWQYFTHEMQVQSENRHILYNKLVNAIANEKLEVYYQPIVKLNDNRIFKCEALVRWFDGGHQVNTADFIALAEETGMINEIDLYVLKTAANFLGGESKALGSRLGLSINLSPRLFTTGEDSINTWLELVAHAAREVDLTVEITERLLTETSDKVLEVLTKLKSLGVSIAIDDFGAGYSSLQYLVKFPIDIIKIDRTFISQLGIDEKAEMLTSAIIALSKRMSFKVVAEGIETAEQLRHLEQWECDFGQGYFFEKPMCGDEFIQVLSKKENVVSEGFDS